MSLKIKPKFDSWKKVEYQFGGIIGDRLQANLQNWLLTAPSANPAMLEMFKARNIERRQEEKLLPWSGEFAGKYIISAVQAYRLMRDKNLYQFLSQFVLHLAEGQADDGYLGPFSESERLIGKGLWDIWGHYHCIYGLLLWYQETGDIKALTVCQRAADYLCKKFFKGDLRVVNAGSEEMNEAIIHVMCLLYETTGEGRYLRFAFEVEKDWQTPPSGDYIRTALAGKEFYQCPKPRWESLPDLQGIVELYYITGEPQYKQAFEHLWSSILNYDRHNTGGFSSGEQATGNPYDMRAIETCCTIAWMALTWDMLRLTGNPLAADELELSTFNAVLGAQSPSGRWWTYNTPMNGVRKASAHEIVFQARAGSPELNCCSVNGPRGLGILSDWAIMSNGGNIVLNYYGPSSFCIPLSESNKVEIIEETDYPKSDEVSIKVTPEIPASFALALRIPSWSKHTHVTVNGERQSDPQPGTYLEIAREWKMGDTIQIKFDFSWRYLIGDKECKGMVSIYRGPILLAYDERFNKNPITNIFTIDFNKPPSYLSENNQSYPSPIIFCKYSEEQKEVYLCDFATAGMTGLQYASWLPAVGFDRPSH